MSDDAIETEAEKANTTHSAPRWLVEIKRAGRLESSWRTRGREILSKYRGTKEAGTATQSFNILYSNTQTIKPTVYSATPQPDVRRRWKDDNPVAKEVATVLERALSFSIDSYDFDDEIESAVDDQLLPGRGVVRVRYLPTIETTTKPREEEGLDENGDETVNIVEEEIDEIVDQEVRCEYVYWEDYRHGPARRMVNRPWEAFAHKYTKIQFEEDFGSEHTEMASFVHSIEDVEDKKKKASGDLLAIVWEIWDKDTRKVYWVTPGVSEFLDTDDDPLDLVDFFSVPDSILYATHTNDTLTPVPLYDSYKELAEELNVIQTRIMKLTDGLKLRGIYPNGMKELAGMLTLGDNQMLGIKDFTVFEGGKSLKDFIMFAPIETIANVITILTQQRDSIKQVIFEVTGISDILRGTTKASETLGAQKIKASFGAKRMDNLQKNGRIFARDLLRMKAEIIASKYEPEILQLMTGVQITPEMLEMMRSDVLRGFMIDIETDSTVAIDKEGESQKATELLSGIASFLTSVGPAVQSGAMSIDVVKDLLLFAVRSAGGGRKVEDAINKIGENVSEGQPGAPQQPGAPVLPPQGVI